MRTNMLVLCLLPLSTTFARADEAEAIEFVKRLRGEITRDEKTEGKPVIGVRLERKLARGVSLNKLEGFKQLQSLNLSLWRTPITDTGLMELVALDKLQDLTLFDTKVTKAGIAKLKKSLPNCKISH